MRKMKTEVVVAALLWTVASLALSTSIHAAEARPYEYFLGAAARLEGINGASFKSDIRVYNSAAVTASVQATLLASADNNAGAPPKTFTVGAGKAVVYEDVILSLFNTSRGAGAIRFLSDQPLVITSNLYTTNSLCPEKGGTLGQFIPAASITEAGTRQRVFHVTDNAAFRTNLGVVNTTNQQANLELIVYDLDTGTVASSAIARLGPYGWAQYNGLAAQLFLDEIPNGMVLVKSDVPVLSYVSVLDNKSNDPFYVAGRNDP